MPTTIFAPFIQTSIALSHSQSVYLIPSAHHGQDSDQGRQHQKGGRQRKGTVCPSLPLHGLHAASRDTLTIHPNALTPPQKAAAAADKVAKEQAVKDAAEDAKWNKGAKTDNKKSVSFALSPVSPPAAPPYLSVHWQLLTAPRAEAEAKKADAARKKAERDALLAAEVEGARAKPKGENKKTATKKSKGTLDLGQLDDSPSSSSKEAPALNASGIENALDALDLTAGTDVKIDRHPERRFKAAYAAFEARRLPEIEEENPGLRRNQRVELVRKEFEKSEENPFNQVAGRFDMSKEELKQLKQSERGRLEGRLGS